MVSRYSYQVEIKGGPRDVDANKTLLPDAQSPTSTPESTRNVKKKLSKTHSPLSSKGDHRLPDDVPTWHSGSPQWPQQEYVPPPPPQQPPPLQQQQQQQHHQPLPELPPPQPRWATSQSPRPTPPTPTYTFLDDLHLRPSLKRHLHPAHSHHDYSPHQPQPPGLGHDQPAKTSTRPSSPASCCRAYPAPLPTRDQRRRHE